MNQIENVKKIPTTEQDTKMKVWENLQLVVLGGTMLGQVLVGGLYFVAQGVWLTCNVLALVRDFVLNRPVADKVKNAALCGLTLALIILRATGIY